MMCTMSAPPSNEEAEGPVIAESGKGITEENPLFRSNMSNKIRSKKVKKSLRINKPTGKASRPKKTSAKKIPAKAKSY